MTIVSTAAPPAEVRHYRARSRLRRVGRGLALAVASLLFLGYVLAPIAWLVSSSFQSEHEIISKPPHWIPQAPTAAELRRDLRRQGQDRHLRDPQGRAIPPAAASFRPPRATCCRRCVNSFIVACAVVVAQPAGRRAGRLCHGQDPLSRPAGLDLHHPGDARHSRYRAGGAVLPVHPQSRPARQPVVADHHLSRGHCAVLGVRAGQLFRIAAGRTRQGGAGRWLLAAADADARLSAAGACRRWWR